MKIENLKFKVFSKRLARELGIFETHKVVNIDIKNKNITYEETTRGGLNSDSFDDVVLLQYTTFNDITNEELYDGDIIITKDENISLISIEDNLSGVWLDGDMINNEYIKKNKLRKIGTVFEKEALQKIYNTGYICKEYLKDKYGLSNNYLDKIKKINNY